MVARQISALHAGPSAAMLSQCCSAEPSQALCSPGCRSWPAHQAFNLLIRSLYKSCARSPTMPCRGGPKACREESSPMLS